MKALLALICMFAIVKANTELDLITDQLSNYPDIDRFVRPIENISHPVVVNVVLAPTTLVSFQPHGEHTGYGTLKVAGWVTQRWSDYHMGWDPSYYGDIERVTLIQEILTTRMWQPDMAPWSGEPWDFPYGDGGVYSDGTVVTFRPALLTFNCIPDHQGETTECSIKMGSWTHDSLEVDIGSTPVLTTSQLKMNPEWTVVESSATREALKYDCCDELYVSATFSITLSPATGPFHVPDHHHHQNRRHD